MKNNYADFKTGCTKVKHFVSLLYGFKKEIQECDFLKKTILKIFFFSNPKKLRRKSFGHYNLLKSLKGCRILILNILNLLTGYMKSGLNLVKIFFEYFVFSIKENWKFLQMDFIKRVGKHKKAKSRKHLKLWRNIYENN